jgi:hypothetical protein
LLVSLIFPSQNRMKHGNCCLVLALRSEQFFALVPVD